jgi:predicted acetyltransferase
LHLSSLTETPRLASPTVAVRDSWIEAERAECESGSLPTDLLERAIADFEGLVAERQGTPIMWGVPTTILWYVAGPVYLGEVVIRHELTPQLARTGGHVGYSVAAPWRRQGHATRMLAEALVHCRRLGLERVLLTCRSDNEASRRVILANGGIADGQIDGHDRYWIEPGPRG